MKVQDQRSGSRRGDGDDRHTRGENHRNVANVKTSSQADEFKVFLIYILSRCMDVIKDSAAKAGAARWVRHAPRPCGRKTRSSTPPV